MISSFEWGKNFVFKRFSLANLRANWYLPISALVFFVMQVGGRSRTSIAEIFIAFFAWILLCSCVIPSDIWKSSADSGIGIKIFSGLTALGICIFSHTFLYERMVKHREAFDKVLELMHMPEHIFYCVSFILSLCMLVFVYLITNYFWHKFLKLIKSSGLFQDISRAEIVFYALIFTVSVISVTAVFTRTYAFYGGDNYNIIYSSDSSYLVDGNCFLNLCHPENDIRQPLFALFSFPFIGLPYLIGRIAALFLGHRELMTVLFMNYTQIAMLIAGIFTLAKAMRLSSLYRAFFTACFACSYIYLLSVLVMEQYIIAFFWLSTCIYFVCKDSQPDRMILYGATGTLTTSVAFTPFYLGGGGGYLRTLCSAGFEFVALILAFSKAGVIYTFFSRLRSLFRFTGIGGTYVSFIDRLKQYSEFVYYSFFSPNAGLHTGKFLSWQLCQPENINYIGLVIFIVAILGAIINHNKKICQISFMWLVYSFLILCVIGWGTAENGLILYSLYFSWAFYILIFMLIVKAEELSGVKFLVPALILAAVCVLARGSLPAILELVDFCTKYYPYSW